MPQKFLALVAGLTLAAGIGAAQKPDANRATADNTFIAKAAQGNLAEVAMGRLDFDRVYMQDMSKDHRTDVAEFRREANRGADPDVQAFASKTLPTLEDHWKTAEEIQKEVKK